MQPERSLTLYTEDIADSFSNEYMYSCIKGRIQDESYFGARRVRGRKGREAYGKTIVFGLKKRKGHVYTQVIKNCSKTEIFPLVSSKISKKTTIFTDGFKTYDSLVNLG